MNIYRTQIGSKASLGRTFGLKGNLYMPIFASLFLGIFLLFLSSMIPSKLSSLGVGLRAFVCFIPFFGTIAYMFIMVIGKPPHYQRDVWERALRGKDFNTTPIKAGRGRHPLHTKRINRSLHD